MKKLKTQHITIIAIVIILIAIFTIPFIAFKKGYYPKKEEHIFNGTVYCPSLYTEFNFTFIKFFWIALLKANDKVSISNEEIIVMT